PRLFAIRIVDAMAASDHLRRHAGEYRSGLASTIDHRARRHHRSISDVHAGKHDCARRDPAIPPDDNLLRIIALQTYRDAHILESVIDGPEGASRTDQRAVADLDAAGGVELRIRTDADVAAELQPLGEINRHATQHAASTFSVIAVEAVTHLASDLSRNRGKKGAVP